MKKTASAFIIGIIMFAPLVSSASLIDDLRAQVLSLTEIVKSLQVKLNALVSAKNAASGNTASVAGVTSSQVIVVSPNGGEVFTQGAQNTISWQGGKGQVSIALVKATVTNANNPSTGGLLVGWIASKAAPGSGISWNAQSTCDLSMTKCSSVTPGSYKVMAVSQDDGGNLTMWDFKQNKAGNWDVSNAAFTIK